MAPFPLAPELFQMSSVLARWVQEDYIHDDSILFILHTFVNNSMQIGAYSHYHQTLQRTCDRRKDRSVFASQVGLGREEKNR